MRGPGEDSGSGSGRAGREGSAQGASELGASIDVGKIGLKVLSVSGADVVVVKPAGMATDLTRDPRRESLIWRVRGAVRGDVTPRLVHRLDRVTRGIVVVSLTRDAASFYGEQIREGVWEKFYIARIPTPTGRRARDVLGRHQAYIKEMETKSELVRAGGKVSLLDVLAISEAPGRAGESHALIRLLSGRLHQIRVMLAGMGLALIGDEAYGGREGSFYLEHAALWYVDCATREVRLAFDRECSEREALGPEVRRGLERATSTGPGERR